MALYQFLQQGMYPILLQNLYPSQNGCLYLKAQYQACNTMIGNAGSVHKVLLWQGYADSPGQCQGQTTVRYPDRYPVPLHDID